MFDCSIRLRHAILVSVGVLTALSGCRQDTTPSPEAPAIEQTSTTKPPVQDPIAEGLWWLYHLQYSKAQTAFTRQAEDAPNDPAGPFYLTAAAWWELAQDFDDPPAAVEKALKVHADETVRRAKKQLQSNLTPHQRGLAELYWGGADGLLGRYRATRSEWMKAYKAGKSGQSHLKKALKADPSLYDAYLGLGIYDYYTDVLPGVMGAFSKVLMRGDRVRGLKELQTAIDKGPRSAVEANVFLIDIYLNQEKKPEKALAIARKLRRDFPLSPAMHLAEITALDRSSQWTAMRTSADDYLLAAEKKADWYRPDDVVPGLYFSGLARLKDPKDPDRCVALMTRIIESRQRPDGRWLTFAYLRRGQAYALQKKTRLARADFKQVLSRKDVWDAHREARDALNSLRS